MKVWLITIGEPIFHPNNTLRLHRTGILAKYISENTDHEVTWWTSAFNHFTKVHLYDQDTHVQVNSNLKMIALYGNGYQKNISFDRITDHKQIADKFKKAALLEEIPDIIVAAFPTLGLCKAAIEYGKNNSIPVLIDYRDMWPEVFVDVLPKPLQIAGKLILKNLFKQTNQVFASSNGLIGITEEFLGLALDKINRQKNENDAVFELGYLENQFTEQQFTEATEFWFEKGIKKDHHIKICFFGTLGHQFELETIVKAAPDLDKDNIQIILCGSGDKLNLLKAMSGKSKNIFFPGYMTAAQIAALMKISDFGLCPYKDKEAFLNSIPGKAIEYMTAGLPLISSLGEGVLGRYVDRHNLGINYSPVSKNDFVKAVRQVAKTISDKDKIRIRKLYEANFKAENIYAKYLNHLEHVVEG